MNYLLRKYNDSLQEDLYNLIEQSLLDDKNRTMDNMKNLFHILPRFDEFNIIYDKINPIACGGIYISDFSNSFAFIGVRSYVLPEYRHLNIIRNILLTHHKRWAINHNLKAIGISFNEHNKNLIKAWDRTRIGENKSPRLEYHLFFHNKFIVPFAVNIKNTKQYVMYEKLDDWDFEWDKIKWGDRFTP